MEFKIRELREAKNMTQEQLSEASGVSRATISALENNNIGNNPSSKTLLSIARALGCCFMDLFLPKV